MFCLTVRLRLGAYDAAMVDDPLSSEWPPHPARIFCALVAGDPTAAEWEALRWLEALPPPEVHASEPLSSLSPQQFLVTNRTEQKGGSQAHPGRRQTMRVKPRIFPTSRCFHVVWPAAEPTPEHRARLTSLARRVPYIGRVTADAEVDVADRIEADSALHVYEPVGLRDAEVDLRVPYPGYGGRLSVAFEGGRRAWEESRRAGYRRRRLEHIEVRKEPVESPFGSLMVFAVDGRSHLGASHTAALTEQLHRAVIRLVEDELGTVPPLISGHDADNRDHVAYLALPNVGVQDRLPGTQETFATRNLFADGRLLALALAIPRGAALEASGLYRSLVTSGTPLNRLMLGSSGIVRLRAGLREGDADALAASRWTKPSHWWATATPIVLDRFPKSRRDDIATLVADAIVTAGYPRPDQVRASRSALLPGAPVLGHSKVQRRSGLPVRPWTHAWVHFETSLRGPLLAGSMRYRGLGLFAPLEPIPTGGTP